MMTPRQIEVWASQWRLLLWITLIYPVLQFQNHRNRAKKEGRILKRSLSDHSLALSLGSLEEKMSAPELSKLSTPEASSEEDETAENVNVCARNTG